VTPAPADHRPGLDRRERAGTAGSPPRRPPPRRPPGGDLRLGDLPGADLPSGDLPGGDRPAVRRLDRDRPRREHGQAAVELALALPFLVVLLLMLVQVGLVVRDQILVVHAAREAVREAAVDPAEDAARAAASESSSLDASRLKVTISGRGGAGSRVRVTASYGPPAKAPIVGAVVHGLRLRASATMRVEG
jgi:hypothetical protein